MTLQLCTHLIQLQLVPRLYIKILYPEASKMVFNTSNWNSFVVPSLLNCGTEISCLICHMTPGNIIYSPWITPTTKPSQPPLPQKRKQHFFPLVTQWKATNKTDPRYLLVYCVFQHANSEQWLEYTNHNSRTWPLNRFDKTTVSLVAIDIIRASRVLTVRVRVVLNEGTTNLSLSAKKQPVNTIKRVGNSTSHPSKGYNHPSRCYSGNSFAFALICRCWKRLH